MFGHDNDDNNDSGQITLPPAQDMDQDTNAPEEAAASSPAPTETRQAPKSGDPASDDLLDIKQQALQALTPLVDHLDQSPEEKFRTTMMMIQASDNHSLIRVAYDAAQQISSDKERAQALLDIVNEINYFTQQNQPS